MSWRQKQGPVQSTPKIKSNFPPEIKIDHRLSRTFLLINQCFSNWCDILLPQIAIFKSFKLSFLLCFLPGSSLRADTELKNKNIHQTSYPSLVFNSCYYELSRVWARNFQFGSLSPNWEFLSFGAKGFGGLLWRAQMGFGSTLISLA